MLPLGLRYPVVLLVTFNEIEQQAEGRRAGLERRSLKPGDAVIKQPDRLYRLEQRVLIVQRLDYRIDDFYVKILFAYAHGLQHCFVFSEGLPKEFFISLVQLDLI
jgi:hypothetical protein